MTSGFLGGLFPDERVQETGDGAFLVVSKSAPGVWHRVADGKCDCVGYANRRHCRHVKLLVETGRIAEPVVAVIPWEPRPIATGTPERGDGALLWTGRYQDKRLATNGLVAVRTTVGTPRFKLGYALSEHVPQMAPDREMFGLHNPPEFRRRYWAKLDRTDADAFRAIFHSISARHGGAGLVLLCFEDVLKGEHCHRRDFADWWFDRTGEEIKELAPAQPDWLPTGFSGAGF